MHHSTGHDDAGNAPTALSLLLAVHGDHVWSAQWRMLRGQRKARAITPTPGRIHPPSHHTALTCHHGKVFSNVA